MLNIDFWEMMVIKRLLISASNINETLPWAIMIAGDRGHRKCLFIFDKAGPCINIKWSFQARIPTVKIRRQWDRLIFVMEIHINSIFILKRSPDSFSLQCRWLLWFQSAHQQLWSSKGYDQGRIQIKSNQVYFSYVHWHITRDPWQ